MNTDPAHVAARALVAAVFVHGGAATLRDPRPRASAAADFLARIRRAVPVLPGDITLVQVNAVAQVGAGALLAAGICQRTAAWTLALSLIPTTVAGHPFWTAAPDDREAEAIQFGKNSGILGALLLLARSGRGTPRPGRP
jgi:uncharacterized membrane protein YphA (DoxX/SURF4 family)